MEYYAHSANDEGNGVPGLLMDHLNVVARLSARSVEILEWSIMTNRNAPRKRLKPVPKIKQAKVDWRKALSKQTKAELIDALVALIKADRQIARRLAERFQIVLPPETWIVETRQAIADATTYDFHEMNSNFGYDDEAYETIQKNFEQLIKTGSIEPAMDLALELMKSGSKQVEMSDQGLMSDDIEDCLCAVIKALKSADLSAETKRTWAKNMQRADRVGFICDEELAALARVTS
jgi:hypothetical protein